MERTILNYENIEFPNILITTIRELDEKEGYRTIIESANEEGRITILNQWSFGHEFWSESISEKWRKYIVKMMVDVKRIDKKIEGNSNIILRLKRIECHYDLEDDSHLKDLEQIVRLLN